ncbi:MAG: VIT1/CCC1 transporter family protein [Elusimicrobia bacterium]|nr:VIT1/CCC1 transporter family protein [Elusimicrobiota bacterium]
MRELIRHTIRNTVFGVEDGLISTLGALTGIAAGTQSGAIVAISGLVIVSVESLSMAAGAYLSSKASKDFLDQILREEAETIERDPEGERQEIREMYSARGFKEAEIAIIERRLMSDKTLLLEDMAHKELGIVPDRHESPATSAVAMGLAYVVGGAIPVIPYLILPIATAMKASIVFTTLALFGLGAAKGKLVRGSWMRSGLEMLTIGGVACALGYLVGVAAAGIR